MRRIHRIGIALGILAVLAVLGALLWRAPAPEQAPGERTSPIPLDQLPALPGPLTYEHNILASLTGNIAASRFSSDPTSPPVPFADPPRLKAFLYNSTPCVAAGTQTTYRLAIYGDSAHPADAVTAHLAAPQHVLFSSFSQPYERHDADTNSYYWALPAPLVRGDVFTVSVQGSITATAETNAQLIVTYAGLETGDIRHVVSTSTIPAC